MRGGCGDGDGGTSRTCHVWTEQAKILYAEAVENNLGGRFGEGWLRWNTCSLCEQDYHGVVGAAGWALEDDGPTETAVPGTRHAWGRFSLSRTSRDASVRRPLSTRAP